MLNKTLIVDDISLSLACIAINIQQPPSTIELVFSELIKLSENGVILNPTALSSTICSKLNIAPENYRRAIMKLTKLKLITRDNSILFLNPIVKTPFDVVTIKQK